MCELACVQALSMQNANNSGLECKVYKKALFVNLRVSLMRAPFGQGRNEIADVRGNSILYPVMAGNLRRIKKY